MNKLTISIFLLLPLFVISQRRNTKIYVGNYANFFIPKEIGYSDLYTLQHHGGVETGVRLQLQSYLKKNFSIQYGVGFNLYSNRITELGMNLNHVYPSLIYDYGRIRKEKLYAVTMGPSNISLNTLLGYEFPLKRSFANLHAGVDFNFKPTVSLTDGTSVYLNPSDTSVTAYTYKYEEGLLNKFKMQFVLQLGVEYPFKNGTGLKLNAYYKYFFTGNADEGILYLYPGSMFSNQYKYSGSRHQLGFELLYQLRKTTHDFNEKLSKVDFGNEFTYSKHQYSISIYSGVNFTNSLLSDVPEFHYAIKPGATLGFEFNYNYEVRKNLLLHSGLRFNIAKGFVEEYGYDLTDMGLLTLPDVSYEEGVYKYPYKAFNYSPFLSIPFGLKYQTVLNKFLMRFGFGTYLKYQFNQSPYLSYYSQISVGQVRLLDYKRLTNPKNKFELGAFLSSGFGVDLKSGHPLFFKIELNYDFDFISSPNQNEAVIFEGEPGLERSVFFKTSPWTLNFGIEVGLRKNRKRTVKVE